MHQGGKRPRHRVDSRDQHEDRTYLPLVRPCFPDLLVLHSDQLLSSSKEQTINIQTETSITKDDRFQTSTTCKPGRTPTAPFASFVLRFYLHDSFGFQFYGGPLAPLSKTYCLRSLQTILWPPSQSYTSRIYLGGRDKAFRTLRMHHTA